MKELYSWMNKIGIDGWKIEPYVTITTTPFNPNLPYGPGTTPSPYDPYPIITCDTSNKDDFIG